MAATPNDESWIRLTVAHEGSVTPLQNKILTAVRSWLENLLPPRLVPAETWAVAFPSEMDIVLPLHGQRHLSFQLAVRQDRILGDWQDAHYAWDVKSDGVFSFSIDADEDVLIANLLQNTEEQLRRPIRRLWWRGPRHVDGREGWGKPSSPRQGRPVGYFDPL